MPANSRSSPPDTVASDFTMHPVSPVAAYDLVAERIRRSIQLGNFVPGDKLAPERELAKQLGVSRMTVREAVRLLAHLGLLEIRRGSRGGILVKPQKITRRDLLALAADADRAVGDVFEFREAVECATTRLAAERATKQQVARLRGLVRSMDAVIKEDQQHSQPANVSRFVAYDTQFHLLIARIADNRLLLEAVERALSERFAPLGALFAKLYDGANDGHSELVDAIAAHDPRESAKLMAQHISATRRELESRLKRQTGSVDSSI